MKYLIATCAVFLSVLGYSQTSFQATARLKKVKTLSDCDSLELEKPKWDIWVIEYKENDNRLDEGLIGLKVGKIKTIVETIDGKAYSQTYKLISKKKEFYECFIMFEVNLKGEYKDSAGLMKKQIAKEIKKGEPFDSLVTRYGMNSYNPENCSWRSDFMEDFSKDIKRAKINKPKIYDYQSNGSLHVWIKTKEPITSYSLKFIRVNTSPGGNFRSKTYKFTL